MASLPVPPALPVAESEPQARAAAEDYPHTRFSRAIDAALLILGRAVSWVWVVMVAVITVNVVMRYLFGEGRIEFEELQWHLYAVGFLLGLSSCYVADAHVRIDVLSENLRFTTRAWIELYGIVLMMVPFLIVIIWFAAPFVAYSFSIREISEAPGGLPLRWAIKAVLLVGMILLGLATLARFTRVTAYLFGAPRAVAPAREN